MNPSNDPGYREWLFRSSFANSLGRQADELYDVPDAEADDEGLIELPLLSLRDLVMFPHMVTPLFVGRERSMAAINEANTANLTLLAVAQLNPEIEDPTPQDRGVRPDRAFLRGPRPPDLRAHR